jgi:hypothetical protein
MMHKIAFEALDRTLRDIVPTPYSANTMLPFGGKVVGLGDDLRQTLPVVQGGSRSDITHGNSQFCLMVTCSCTSS